MYLNQTFFLFLFIHNCQIKEIIRMRDERSRCRYGLKNFICFQLNTKYFICICIQVRSRPSSYCLHHQYMQNCTDFVESSSNLLYLDSIHLELIINILILNLSCGSIQAQVGAKSDWIPVFRSPGSTCRQVGSIM